MSLLGSTSLTQQVSRCTKIIDEGTPDAKYIINVKQIGKFVVALGDRVSPTDVEEAMRVGCDKLNS
jgi:26S proteasome regulatory subunit T1